MKQRRATPVSFYRDYLDGVFTSEDVALEASEFVERYFRFDRGQYISDYLRALDPDARLPSIFHVADTWENFDRIDPVRGRSDGPSSA